MPNTWRTETDMSGKPAARSAVWRVMGGGSLFGRVALRGLADAEASTWGMGLASDAYASPACFR